MNELSETVSSLAELSADLAVHFDAIQQPESNFKLDKFIVGEHPSEPRQWFQCVLELQKNITNLEHYQITRRQMLRKIGSLRNGGDEAKDEAGHLMLDLRELDKAARGVSRMVIFLYEKFKSFSKTYTWEELRDAEPEYWLQRLTTEATHQLIATGRVGFGTAQSLKQIGHPITMEFIREIEARICPSRLLESASCISQEPSPATSPTDAQMSLGSDTTSASVSANLALSSDSENA